MKDRILAATLFASAIPLFLLLASVYNGTLDREALQPSVAGVLGLSAGICGAVAAPRMARAAVARSVWWGLAAGVGVVAAALAVALVLVTALSAIDSITTGTASDGTGPLYTFSFGLAVAMVMVVLTAPFGALAGVAFFALVRRRAARGTPLGS